MTSTTPPPPVGPPDPPSPEPSSGTDAAAWPQTPTDDPLDPEPARPGGTGDAGEAAADEPSGHPEAARPEAPPAAEPSVVAPVTTDAEGITADLWAFRFDDPVMAQEALLAAMRLQRRKRLELDDAAIVVRDERGRTRIVQTRDLSTAQGAMSGSWLGLLAGLFVPGGALVGMALGAAAGGLFAKLRDKGINDDEMKQWGEQLSDGQAALFLLVEDCHRMRALHEVARFPATVLTSTGPVEVVEAVRDRLAVDPWGP